MTQSEQKLGCRVANQGIMFQFLAAERDFFSPPMCPNWLWGQCGHIGKEKSELRTLPRGKTARTKN
jgi:hypothetical protein